MTIKAVIFDLDGVIADSEPLSGEATRKALARLDIEMTDKERNEAFGRRTGDIINDILSGRNMKADVEAIIAEKGRIFSELIKNNIKPIPKSLELVEWLKGKGYKVALATSSHTEKMETELKELGIEKLFDVIVCGDDVRKGKPDPEIFLKTAEKLAAKPEECAVIEDSQFGVQAAKFAGMKAIAFDSLNTHGQDLSAADVVVDDLEKVKEHIK